ncbi:MAG: hypothetical protein LBH04_03980 [Tannerellaceae bacterium]|nr:hypothetical protein [Tannerellaceae bacterium]
MKKIAYIFLLLSLVMQVALAQKNRPVVVSFLNGKVMKGLVTKLPDSRLRLQAPNGTVTLFSPKEVRRITYEDGTFVPLNNIPYYQQQNRQAARPQQGGQQGQLQAQNRQGTRPQQGQPNQQNRQGARPQQGQSNRQGASPQQRQPNQQNRQGATPQQRRPNQQNQQTNRTQPKTSQTENNETLLDEEDTDILLTPVDKKLPPANKVDTVAAKEEFRSHSKFFLDAGYTIGMGDGYNNYGRIELSLGYGMQITPKFAIGIGAGLHLYGDSVYLAYRSDTLATSHFDSISTKMVIPIFIDANYEFTEGGSVTPYFGFRLGYGLGIVTTTSYFKKGNDNWKRDETSPTGLGFYISPSLGAKFAIGTSARMNLSIGYTMQMRSYLITTKALSKSGSMGGVTIRAGLEF